MTKTIKVLDFTEYPGPRYKRLGEGSGEEFRDHIFIPAMKEHGSLVVDLDGTRGFGSSFLEEAFGGAVRLGIKMDPDNLKFESKNEALVNRVWEYINNAKQDR